MVPYLGAKTFPGTRPVFLETSATFLGIAKGFSGAFWFLGTNWPFLGVWMSHINLYRPEQSAPEDRPGKWASRFATTVIGSVTGRVTFVQFVATVRRHQSTRHWLREIG